MWVLLNWYQYTECKQPETEQRVGNATEHMYLLILHLLPRETRGLFTLKVSLNLEASNLFGKTVLLDAILARVSLSEASE